MRLRSFEGRPLSKVWLNNAGLDGHSNFGHIVLVRDYVSKLKPKAVLILVGLNDLFANEPKTLDHLDRSELAGRIADHSEFFGLGLNMVRYWRTAGLKSLGTMPKALNLKEPEYRACSDYPTGVVRRSPG